MSTVRSLAAAAVLIVSPSLAMAEVYVNPFAGMLVFDTTTTVGGVKLVDQGGDASQAGIRVGYGHRWPGGLYLGAEAEGFLASGRSRAVVNGETYSWSVNGGAGAYASHDGYQIWLEVDRGERVPERVALEPYVLRSLIEYARSIGMIKA